AAGSIDDALAARVLGLAARSGLREDDGGPARRGGAVVVPVFVPARDAGGESGGRPPWAAAGQETAALPRRGRPRPAAGDARRRLASGPARPGDSRNAVFRRPARERVDQPERRRPGSGQ